MTRGDIGNYLGLTETISRLLGPLSKTRRDFHVQGQIYYNQ